MQSHTILNHNTFDFKNSSIIKPPFEDFKNMEIIHKNTRIVIDSRDRNTRIHPTPSQYDVELYEEIEEVTSAKLILADIPFNQYLIRNGFNDILHVNNKQIRLSEGNYTATTLKTMLTSALFDEKIYVHYEESTDKLEFWGKDPFNFDFLGDIKDDGVTTYKQRSIAKVIGFDNRTYSSSVTASTDPLALGYTHRLLSPFRINLNENKYIILNIDQFSVNSSINTNINKSFALIHKNENNLNICTDDLMVTKYFNPPIAKLSKLRLTFKNYDGSLYDFQNQDHRIEILLQSNKHPKRYHSFV